MSHFYSIAIHIQSLEAVYRGSETKLQVTRWLKMYGNVIKLLIVCYFYSFSYQKILLLTLWEECLFNTQRMNDTLGQFCAQSHTVLLILNILNGPGEISLDFLVKFPKRLGKIPKGNGLSVCNIIKLESQYLWHPDLHHHVHLAVKYIVWFKLRNVTLWKLPFKRNSSKQIPGKFLRAI